MTIETKYNVGDEVCFLAKDHAPSITTIRSINVKVNGRSVQIEYVVVATTTNVFDVYKEHALFPSMQSLREYMMNGFDRAIQAKAEVSMGGKIPLVNNA